MSKGIDPNKLRKKKEVEQKSSINPSLLKKKQKPQQQEPTGLPSTSEGGDSLLGSQTVPSEPIVSQEDAFTIPEIPQESINLTAEDLSSKLKEIELQQLRITPDIYDLEKQLKSYDQYKNEQGDYSFQTTEQLNDFNSTLNEYKSLIEKSNSIEEAKVDFYNNYKERLSKFGTAPMGDKIPGLGTMERDVLSGFTSGLAGVVRGLNEQAAVLDELTSGVTGRTPEEIEENKKALNVLANKLDSVSATLDTQGGLNTKGKVGEYASMVNKGIGNMAVFFIGGGSVPAGMALGASMNTGYQIKEAEDKIKDAKKLTQKEFNQKYNLSEKEGEVSKRNLAKTNIDDIRGEIVGSSSAIGLLEGSVGLLGRLKKLTPVANYITKLNTKTGGALANTLRAADATMGSRATVGFLTEATQEGTAQLLNNTAAYLIYDEARDFFDGVPEEALIGGILGGPISAFRGKAEDIISNPNSTDEEVKSAQSTLDYIENKLRLAELQRKGGNVYVSPNHKKLQSAKKELQEAIDNNPDSPVNDRIKDEIAKIDKELDTELANYAAMYEGLSKEEQLRLDEINTRLGELEVADQDTDLLEPVRKSLENEARELKAEKQRIEGVNEGDSEQAPQVEDGVTEEDFSFAEDELAALEEEVAKEERIARDRKQPERKPRPKQVEQPDAEKKVTALEMLGEKVQDSDGVVGTIQEENGRIVWVSEDGNKIREGGSVQDAEAVTLDDMQLSIIEESPTSPINLTEGEQAPTAEPKSKPISKEELEVMDEIAIEEEMAKAEREAKEFEEEVLQDAAKQADVKRLIVPIGNKRFAVSEKPDGTYTVSQENENGRFVAIRDKEARQTAINEFNKLKEQKGTEALRQAEELAEEFKKEQEDRVLAFIDSLKYKPNQNRLSISVGVIEVPAFVWNGMLETVKASYKAGKALSKAISDGAALLRKQGYDVNDADVKKAFVQTKGKPEQETENQDTDAISKQQTTEIPSEQETQTVQEVEEEVRGEQEGEGAVEEKVEEVSQKTGITPKNLRDLYRINRDLFGLNRAKSLASAVTMDRMVGAMAKRAGVSKKEMYGKLEFRKANEKDLPQGVKMQVDAWHGSPYQFDKFTVEAIGTGEGAQAFGWGLYFTELESIARHYAKSLSNKPDPVKEVLFSHLKNESRKDRVLKDLNDTKDILFELKDYDAVNNVEAAIELVKSIDRENVYDFDFENKGNLYKVSLHKEKTPDQYNWLEWDKRLTDSQRNAIISQAKKEGMNLEEHTYPSGSKGIVINGKDGEMKAIATNGKQIYEWLYQSVGGRIFDTDKDVSLFLLRAGIDGIKYPAESISRGATSDTARGFNYVVFDENAVSIEKVIKFQKDAEKARGAAMVNIDGTAIIYALTDPNVSTPLHELAHVFEHYLTDAERTSVLKWANAKEWDVSVSEKFARGFEKFLSDGKAPTASLQKIFNRFKEWLTEIYNGIKGSEIDIELNKPMKDIYAKMLGETTKEQEGEGATTQKQEREKEVISKLRTVASAFKKGRVEQRKDIRDFAQAIKEALSGFKKGVVTAAKAKTIANRAAKVTTEKQLDNFIDYASKVLQKASYQEDLKNVRKKKARAKQKRKSGNLGSDGGETRDALRIEPSTLSLKDFERYNSMLSEMVKAGYNRAKVQDDIQYFSDLYREKAKEAVNSFSESPSKGRKDSDEARALREVIKKQIKQKTEDFDESKRDEYLIFTSMTESELEQLGVNELKELSQSIENIETFQPISARATEIARDVDANRKKSAFQEATNDKGFNTLLRNTISKVFRGREASLKNIKNYIRNTPLNRIDTILKGKKGTTLYKSFIQPISVAYSNYLGRLNSVQNAYNSLYKKVKNKEAFDIKAALIALGKQKEFNPSAKEVGSVEEYIEAIKEAARRNNSFTKLANKYLEQYNSMLDEDGNFDWEKSYNELSNAEKKAFDYVENINSQNAELVEIGAARNGKPTVIYNYYTPLNVMFMEKSNIQDILNDANSFVADKNIAVGESQTFKERTVGAKPIFLDFSGNFIRATRSTYKDYYLRNPLRTFSKAINKIKSAPESTATQIDFAEALSSAISEVVKNQFINDNYESPALARVKNLLAKRGYQAALASAPRAGAEFISNFSHAIATSPREFERGLSFFIAKNKSYKFSYNDLMELTRLANSSQFTRLFQKEGGLMEEQGLSAIKSVTKLGKGIDYINNSMVSVPDRAIAMPLWVGTFVRSFEKQTGEKIDVQKFVKDAAYREKFNNEIEFARDNADRKLSQGFATMNPFEGIIASQVTKKDDIVKIFDKYMTRFIRFEYQSLVDSFYGLIGQNDLTRGEGAALAFATLTRMALYTTLYKMLKNMFYTAVESLLGIEGDREDEMDDEEVLNSLYRGYVGSALTLVLSRRLGNIGRTGLNYGVEVLNRDYGDMLSLRKKDEKYNSYDNSLVFSTIKVLGEGEYYNNNKMAEDFLVGVSGPYSKIVKTFIRGAQLQKKVGLRNPFADGDEYIFKPTLKTQEAIDRNRRELAIRIYPQFFIETAGMPLAKDVEALIIRETFEDYEKNNKNKVKSVRGQVRVSEPKRIERDGSSAQKAKVATPKRIERE